MIFFQLFVSRIHIHVHSCYMTDNVVGDLYMVQDSKVMIFVTNQSSSYSSHKGAHKDNKFIS